MIWESSYVIRYVWKVLFVSIFASMCNDMGFVLCHPGCRKAAFVSIFLSICNSMGVILRPSLSHLSVPDPACRQTTALHRCFALLFAHILPIHETLEGQDLFCRPWINSCSTSPDSPEPVRCQSGNKTGDLRIFVHQSG